MLCPLYSWGPFHWVQNVSSVSESAAAQQAHRHAVTIATAMPPACLFHNQMRRHEKTAISAIRRLKENASESRCWYKKVTAALHSTVKQRSVYA